MEQNLELRNNETLIEVTKGDLWVGWSIFSEQKRGNYTFTNQRAAFTPTKLLGMGSNIEFEYNDVMSLHKCSIGLFFPLGIKVVTKQGKKYKLSLLKRNNWFDFIQERI